MTITVLVLDHNNEDTLMGSGTRYRYSARLDGDSRMVRAYHLPIACQAAVRLCYGNDDVPYDYRLVSAVEFLNA